MSGPKSCLAAVALLGWFGASAHAQGIVPGEWANQFGSQTFGGSGFVGGVTFGYGMSGGGGGVSPFGGGGRNPFGLDLSPYGQGYALFGPNTGPPTYPGSLYRTTAPVSQTVSGVDPLIHVIRQRPGPRGVGEW